MSDLTLTAGIARMDITPPVGFRMQGAMRRIEGSVGIESPLLATAIVLADEETKIVIVDCDLLGFDLPLAEEIRQIIGERLGTPSSHVTVGCTYTHNGPCTSRYCVMRCCGARAAAEPTAKRAAVSSSGCSASWRPLGNRTATCWSC